MSKNTGGPAFPSGVVRKTRQRPNDPGSDFIVSDTVEVKNPGLTLRDYFAAKALAPLIAAMVESISEPQFEMVLAAQSYLIADAMIEEREK